MVSPRLALSLAAAFAAGSGATYAATVAARVEVVCPALLAPLPPVAAGAPPSRDWLAPPPPPVTGGARY